MKFLTSFALIFTLQINAEWIFVDESNGIAGIGKGDNVYIWKTYTTGEDGMKEFKLLFDYKIPDKHGYSAVQEEFVYCGRPHRIMLGDTESFSQKMGKGKSTGKEQGGWWITIADDSVFRKAVNMICKIN